MEALLIEELQNRGRNLRQSTNFMEYQGYEDRGTNTGNAYIWVSRLEVPSLEVPRPGVPRLEVPRPGVPKPGVPRPGVTRTVVPKPGGIQTRGTLNRGAQTGGTQTRGTQSGSHDFKQSKDFLFKTSRAPSSNFVRNGFADCLPLCNSIIVITIIT